MKPLKEKLKSKDGASLILSLLVFLLCVMVASSVFAAAVSNAGKARSSRVEQQRYQTLSSAVRLICGELEKIEYTGKYNLYHGTDSSSSSFFYYEQQPGSFKMQDTHNSQSFQLTNFPLLAETLQKEMDEVFRRQFLKTDGSGKDGYKPLAVTDVLPAGSSSDKSLTVTLPDNLTGYPYAGSTPKEYGIPKTVNIKIELDHDNPRNIITLTAWLDDSGALPSKGSGIMIAELMADIAPEPEPPNPTDVPGSAPSGTTATEKTVFVKWKLDGIRMTTVPTAP